MVNERPGRRDTQRKIKLGMLPDSIGYMLRQAQMLTYQLYFEQVGAENVRPVQFALLEIIGSNPGIRPTDVSEAVGVTRANLVPMLVEFDERGLVRRDAVAEDRRAQALHLTEAGEALRQRLITRIQEHEDQLAKPLGAKGREKLMTLLKTLVTSFPE